ncbi:MAG: cupin domain-containing protein [Chloroflexota bacterium]
MPVVRATDAPSFEVHGATITGGAAPSRGSVQTCVWRVNLSPGSSVPAHILSHEEIFHVLSGTLLATVDGEEHRITSGDTLIVHAGATLQIAVPPGDRFQAVVVLPAGALARFADGGDPFTPPWAV